MGPGITLTALDRAVCPRKALAERRLLTGRRKEGFIIFLLRGGGDGDLCHLAQLYQVNTVPPLVAKVKRFRTL